jgi:protein disulfide-isomerase
MSVHLTLYHADWCGHCQKFKPIWFEVKEKFKNNKKFKFDEVEETQMNGKLPKINNKEIRGFPTIKVVNGNTEAEYGGNRDLETFISFINAL